MLPSVAESQTQSLTYLSRETLCDVLRHPPHNQITVYINTPTQEYSTITSGMFQCVSPPPPPLQWWKVGGGGNRRSLKNALPACSPTKNDPEMENIEMVRVCS
eukprot:gene5368-biopygen13124